MYYILYNPLSNGGTCFKKVTKLEEKLKSENKEVKCISLLDIENNMHSFLDSLNKEDIVVIVGGDGTLYHAANTMNNYDLKDKTILFAKAGTGNDFYRDVKHLSNDGFVKIDKYLANAPTVAFNDKVNRFNNSCGIGVDGDICNRVNASKRKSAIHYLFNCLKAVLNFKRFTLTAKIDGVEHVFKNTWFTTVMQGKYFGGGMKVAPDQDRDSEELTMIVAHNVCTALLVFILPTIYIGQHVHFKKYVSIFKCKEVELHTSAPQFIEIDGDIEPNIDYVKIKK